ncbi:DEAD/DEAH box helicase family protein [Nocardioides dongkuii]|uniref:DEAD/DEAH box helicase family protein n=1 Tax=Nocardioides dongkuii TaxID=2760089 RepID=UPI001FD58E31|nr:DEAD/DEAH box helicase family protein [Nocardioides dongkuii]
MAATAPAPAEPRRQLLGPPPLRTHQARALEALGRAWAAGRSRSWVVLPPGAGKTRVGLETIAEALAGGGASRAVVLSPNTAIQAQWAAAATAHGLEAGTDRDLSSQVTSLTYQSIAVFETDTDVDGDLDRTRKRPAPTEAGALMDRLHPNGRALVETLRDVDGLVLVLDECHHLLEVWGRLLGELLHTVEDAQVLGLTATPPDALTPDQAELVEELFSDVVFRAGVPAVVKEGHLAPFAELAWLTTPTAHENEWLAAEASRWRELTTFLSDPTFGTVPFLSWVTSRFVAPVPTVRSWAELAKAEPALADAALRLCHSGLLELPEGARLLEQHRRDPDADDWVALLDDWATTHLMPSTDPADAAVVETIRAALPSVGHVLTRRGVRRGRTPVDRVLARSHAKTVAAAEIVSHEHATLGDRTRMLVLCDYERASATLPTGLEGVLDAQSGSACSTVETLVADPATAGLSPLMVTGSTVAGAPATLSALATWVYETHPRLAGRLTVTGDGPVATLTGPWSSRHWVAPITSFFEAGHSQVLVGTRGLLGEGWDARRITGLVDLTTATTLTAVVQTRGRALRTDPSWAEKVAVNWSVVCVSDAHPKGGNDWARLVRKHTGFHGVDDDGDIVDGVSHIDPAFSPYAPPPTSTFEAINARMRARAADRDQIRSAWRVGEPYRDEVAATLRVVLRAERTEDEAVADGAATSMPLEIVPAPLVLHRHGIEVRDGTIRPPSTVTWVDTVAAVGTLGGVVGTASGPVTGWYLAAGGVAAVAGGVAGTRSRARGRTRVLSEWVSAQARRAAAAPSVGQVAAAVADALHRAGLTVVGAEAVVVEIHPGGEHRCLLDSTEADAALFAGVLDEALAPIGTQRYVLSRYTMTAAPTLTPRQVRKLRSSRAAVRALAGFRANGEAWHPVPSVLGANASRAAGYLAAWHRWVADGDLLYTSTPEGAGVLAAQQGYDPFDATTVVRRHWR